MRRWTLLLSLAGLSFAAAGASRPTYGQTLHVLWTGAETPQDPLLADAPEEAALLRLWTEGVCHAEERGAAPVLAQVSQPSALQLVFRVPPHLAVAGGRPLTSLEFARAWQRLAEPSTRSPYRALLAPVRGQGSFLTGAALKPDALVLPLSYPFPDLAEALCHPAFSVTVADGLHRTGLGPYQPAGAKGAGTANLRFPEGRPYPDAVRVTLGDERQVSRRFTAHAGQVRLGAGARTSAPAPLLFATYLLFREEATGPGFRRMFESAVDVSQLTQLFVPAPSRPLAGLLPSSGLAAARPAAGPATGAPAAHPAFTLLYDSSLDFAQPVAERLQVKLHDAGYRVHLLGLSRAELRGRWARGNFDAMLASVLLPRPPAAALAVVLELAGNPGGALDRELPPLGAIADPKERAARAEQRANALAAQLPLLPLFTQGARVQADDAVENLGVGADGVPRLDEVFLAPAAGAH